MQPVNVLEQLTHLEVEESLYAEVGHLQVVSILVTRTKVSTHVLHSVLLWQVIQSLNGIEQS